MLLLFPDSSASHVALHSDRAAGRSEATPRCCSILQHLAFSQHIMSKREKQPKKSSHVEPNCSLLMEILEKNRTATHIFPPFGFLPSAEDEGGQPGRVEEHPRAASLGAFPGIPGAAAEPAAGPADLSEWAEPLVPVRTGSHLGVGRTGGFDDPPTLPPAAPGGGRSSSGLPKTTSGRRFCPLHRFLLDSQWRGRYFNWDFIPSLCH